MTRSLVNVLAFQAGWLACVVSAANGLPWTGATLALAFVVLHLFLAANALAELRLILLALVLGAIFDSALLTTAWVGYPSGVLVANVAPYWILAMWALFATTLNACLSWLKRSLALAAALGAVFGPLSYSAGARLGGIALHAPLQALLAVALIWAVAMPALVAAARRHNGIDAASVAPRLGLLPQA